MGWVERPIVEIAKRLQRGDTVTSLRSMRGVAFALGGRESPPAERFRKTPFWWKTRSNATVDCELVPRLKSEIGQIGLVKATRIIHTNTKSVQCQNLVQYHGDQAVICQPPQFPLSTPEMDQAYDRPYTRKTPPQIQGADSRF